MIQENFIKLYESSFKENWDLPAFTDYTDKTTLNYSDFAQEIAKLHILFEQMGVNKGDKISLIGRNNIQWATTYMSVITYGAVIVPILQDFNPNDIHHIVNHSDSKLLFVGDNIWETLEEEELENIDGIFSLTDYRSLSQHKGSKPFEAVSNIEKIFHKKYETGFSKENIKYADCSNSELVLINYTSGTTGFSKGVMLSGNNLGGNTVFGIRQKLHFKGSRCLSFLPLAHAYGCAFDYLVPLAVGTHITLLGKIPSPKIILQAFEEVKPHLICSVPLVLEKIYKKTILPQLNKRTLRWALNIPILDQQIYKKIRAKMVESFGGVFEQIIIGGAPLNKEVEEFLYKIKFPFTVGYGMTECGPLISYTHHSEFIPCSAGKPLNGFMEVKIDSNEPQVIPGEILVKGENVMMGYYKNEEATNSVLDSDGWLHTGDMGTVDINGTIFIRGRSKTMILGSSGQNIYPEEIESKLNNLPFVMESLVIEKNGKLVALVYPDYGSADSFGLAHEDLPIAMEENRKNLNKTVAPYETVSSIRLYPTEFEKTPKKSIKRYLYSSILDREDYENK
ncbi:MAG: AMP-binding protein [Bacteroidales bacterium]|nr:AMP-binding protein [Bacteroidales bacterium]